jgi:hypothetical protein
MSCRMGEAPAGCLAQSRYWLKGVALGVGVCGPAQVALSSRPVGHISEVLWGEA